MARRFSLLSAFFLGLTCPMPARGAEPTTYAVVNIDASIRSAPPQVEPTGKRIPFGTVVVVAEEKAADGKVYVRVHAEGDPKAEFGWTAKSNLGSTKEFDPTMKSDDAVDDKDLKGTRAVMAAIYNARGKYLKEQANALGASPAALAAVLKVESGGRGFGLDGRVTVRFENHVFWRRWGEANKERFNQHFQFDPKEGWKGHEWRKAASDPWTTFHGNQTNEWQVLEFARTLDEPAALASASYGVGQIMGFNFKAVGYPSAQAMAKKFDEGIKPQLDAMVAFIKGNKKCMEGLTTKDYTRFAEGYNGTSKAAAYGALIKEAAEAYSEVTKGKKFAE